jgi:hypothetical protein
MVPAPEPKRGTGTTRVRFLPPWLFLLLASLFVITAPLACAEEVLPESVGANATLAAQTTSALTVGSLAAINGTYGAGCIARTGSWSVRVSGVAALANAALSVVKNNTACVLTVTSLVADQTYVATPAIALTGAYQASASAFSAGGVVFHGNAKLGATTFASDFVVTLLYSQDPGSTASTFTASGTYTIFDGTETPATDLDTSATQAGLKFRPKSNGQVTAVKFHKAAVNTGTHVGRLWTLGGTSLGSVTFTGETASGWQTATFASPIAVTAYTTYIVSVYMPVGRYSSSTNYWTSARDRPQLQAPFDGECGTNGVYAYSDSATFPTTTYNAANYWVDVVFTNSGGTTAGPIVQQWSGSTGTTSTSSVTITLPSATATGRQLVLAVASDTTLDTPTGFTLDRSQVNGDGLYLFRKATAAGETSWTLTPTASTRLGWWAAELSGLQASPVDVVSGNVGSGWVTSLATQSITPTSGPRLLLSLHGRSGLTGWLGDAFPYTNSFLMTGAAVARQPDVGVAALSVATRQVTANGSTAYATTLSFPSVEAPNSIIVAYKM